MRGHSINCIYAKVKAIIYNNDGACFFYANLRSPANAANPVENYVAGEVCLHSPEFHKRNYRVTFHVHQAPTFSISVSIFFLC